VPPSHPPTPPPHYRPHHSAARRRRGDQAGRRRGGAAYVSWPRTDLPGPPRRPLPGPQSGRPAGPAGETPMAGWAATNGCREGRKAVEQSRPRREAGRPPSRHPPPPPPRKTTSPAATAEKAPKKDGGVRDVCVWGSLRGGPRRLPRMDTTQREGSGGSGGGSSRSAQWCTGLAPALAPDQIVLHKT
jgi:hypothetical protein